MTEDVRNRCKELAELAKEDANGWVAAFSNDYKGKVMFCLALASAVWIMRDLVPVLNGTGQNFIDAVKEGTQLWVELGEPLRAEEVTQ